MSAPAAGTQAPHTRPVPGLCAEGSGSDSLLPSPQTRVLVTHGISFLPQTDFVIVLADGQVSEIGTYAALLQRNGSFANFLRNYAPDEGKKHQEADSRTGICHSWPSVFPCPPSISAVLEPLSVCGQAQCFTREVLGNLDHLRDVRHHQQGK